MRVLTDLQSSWQSHCCQTLTHGMHLHLSAACSSCFFSGCFAHALSMLHICWRKAHAVAAVTASMALMAAAAANEAITTTFKAVTAANEEVTTTTKAVTAANEAITTTTRAVTTATEAVACALHDNRLRLVSRPATALSKLDFPQPEGPTMSRELPACRVSFRLWQRWRPPAGVNRVRPLRVSPACGLCTRCMWDELAVSCKRAAAHRLLSMGAVCGMSLLCHARELQQTEI